MAELVSTAALIKAASPIIKDLYECAKGEIRKSLEKWGSSSFPEKFSRSLADIDTVRTIWSPERNVSLRSIYYPSKIILKNGDEKTTSKISDLGDRCTVLQGIVGQGKSILLRYLAIQEILDKTPRIPLLIELRKLSNSTSLSEEINRTLSAYDIEPSNETFDYLASSGKMVLLLDGFDELEESINKQTTIEIERLSIKHPRLQIIVSSRPNNEIQKINTFDVINIAKLKEDDYRGFLEKLGVAPSRNAEIIEAINASKSNVSGLITTPLMLTLVVFVYQSENQIPDELPEFFEKLFYTVFTRHDKLKPFFERKHYTGLSERKLQTLFEAFCFVCMQSKNSRTLKPEQFTEAFETAQECIEGSPCSESNFRKDITRTACLMLEDGFNETTFLHKSIAEYHASAFIKGSDDEFAAIFYEEASSAWSHWNECLAFLESIDPYRFARYFSIPNITRAIQTLEPLASCTTGKEFFKHLPSWSKNINIHFELDISTEGEKFYKHYKIGSWQSSPNTYESELANLIVRASYETTPDTLTEPAIAELREDGVQIQSEGEGRIAISLTEAITVWGVSRYTSETSIYIQKLRHELEKAKALSEKLAKRATMLSKRKEPLKTTQQ